MDKKYTTALRLTAVHPVMILIPALVVGLGVWIMHGLTLGLAICIVLAAAGGYWMGRP